MNVLVLGASGSVGGHLVRQGLARGHQITVLVRSPEKMRAYEGRLTILQREEKRCQEPFPLTPDGPPLRAGLVSNQPLTIDHYPLTIPCAPTPARLLI